MEYQGNCVLHQMFAGLGRKHEKQNVKLHADSFKCCYTTFSNLVLGLISGSKTDSL